MDKLNDASRGFIVDSAANEKIVSMGEIADRLRDCLEELDRLQVWQVGAHVSQALSQLEVEICASL